MRRRKDKLIDTSLGLFRSYDEYYFACWLEELKKEGSVLDWKYEPYSLIITEGVYNSYTIKEELKTKTKFVDKEQVILNPSEYTPDFLVFWPDSANMKLFDILHGGRKITSPYIAHCTEEGCFSLVEVKPRFDRNNMTRLFVNNQKVIWEKYELYINITMIEDLFPETFTPREYTKTPTGKKRKLKWPNITVKSFLKKDEKKKR